MTSEIVTRNDTSRQIVFTNYDFNEMPRGKGYSFLIRAIQPNGTDILSNESNLNDGDDTLRPLEENILDTYFIAGHVTPALNLTCLTTT